MANTWKTLSDGDIGRKIMARMKNQRKFIGTVNRDYDEEFGRKGAKNGGTLLIREPNRFTVRSGEVMQTQDIAESTQSLVMSYLRGVDIDVSSIDHTLSVDQFEERVVNPAADDLMSQIEYVFLSSAYKDVFNYTGTPATTPASLAAILNAGARLSQNLAPTNDRSVLMDSVAMAATVNGIGTYFHKASEIEKGFSDGYIGRAGGFKFYESNMVPSHTNGSRTDATPVIDTSTIADGATTITTTGQTNTQTLKAGDVFTIAGVFAINPQTKQAYSHLQQFVVRTDKTCDATDVFDVAPTIYISGAKQNVSVVSAGAGKAIVHVAAGGSGAASTAYTMDLAYHRDAFTFVCADEYIMPGEKMTRVKNDGLSLRIWQKGDQVNNTFPLRIDCRFGFKTVRPEWATRMRG